MSARELAAHTAVTVSVTVAVTVTAVQAPEPAAPEEEGTSVRVTVSVRVAEIVEVRVMVLSEVDSVYNKVSSEQRIGYLTEHIRHCWWTAQWSFQSQRKTMSRR